MKPIRLLVIDPQNDFLDLPGAALPVTGANADMDRLAAWLRAHIDRVDDLVVTLDSHGSVGVERTSFWHDGQGGAVAPFTAITAADVRAGRYAPRDAALRGAVLDYLDALEQQARRTLVVWPIHCVVGTWGHTLHAGLAGAVAEWEYRHLRSCDKVLKGMHPLTEQYSAFKAEVPRADDPRTALNAPLMDALARGDGWLLVGGEALSHCVAASVDDLLAHGGPALARRLVLLTDCMSPVTGFEAAGAAFLERARAAGARTLASTALAEALG